MTSSRPRIIAHRGASADEPENTLRAFRRAWELDVDAIELDVYRTRDGQIVCHHDADTQRQCGVSRLIAQCAWSELCDLDAARFRSDNRLFESIPLLESVLEEAPPERAIYIEIKCGTEIVEAIVPLLVRYSHLPIIVMSFQLDVVLAVRKAMSSHRQTNIRYDSILPSKKHAELVCECFAEIKRAGLDGLALDQTRLTRDVVKSARAFFNRVACWTVDDPVRARELAEWGITDITTNDPARIIAEFEK